MMRVLPVMDDNMQRDPCFQRKLPQELMHKLYIKAAYPIRGIFRTIFKMRSIAYVDNDLGKRFVHRNKHTGVSLDSAFITQRLTQTLS
ncbi:hypothetical protein D3C73_1457700 [compost metagenome]